MPTGDYTFSESDYFENKGSRPNQNNRGGGSPTGGPGGFAGAGFGFGGGRSPMGMSMFMPGNEGPWAGSALRRRLLMRLLMQRGMGGGMGVEPMPGGPMPEGMGTVENPTRFAFGGMFGRMLQKRGIQAGPGLGSTGSNPQSGFNSQQAGAVNKDAPTFDQSNPYGFLSGQTRNDLTGWAHRGIGAAGQAGFFDPMGSPAMREAVRRRALQSGDAARKRSRLAGDVYGLDPAQRAFGNLQADLNAQGDVSRIGSGLEADMLFRNQDYFRDLADTAYGNEAQSHFAGTREAAQRDAARRARKGANSLGGIIGGIAGQGLGGWIGDRWGG